MKEEKTKIIIKCLELNQPIGKFYIGVITHEDLFHISYSDIRRLETGTDEREIETYIGIQRPLQEKRVKEISEYVNLVDATFPTGIILAVSDKDVSFNEKTNEMEIEYRQDVAKVLDGQHRIAGLEKYSSDVSRFELNITIFVDMELEDQAIVFSTINKTQTKVNKSLVADLFEFASKRSPQKTAHNIARALNEKVGSPFEGKIKILGIANDKNKETITQATFVESLLKYISKNEVIDRDIYKRGKKLNKIIGKDTERQIFRNLFIDEQDDKIAQIIWNYFLAVSKRWPKAWNEIKVDMILNKSTGFVALMKFLKNAYLSFNKDGEIISVKEFSAIFDKIDIDDSGFSKQNYLPGGGGQNDLYKDFLSKSGLSNG